MIQRVVICYIHPEKGNIQVQYHLSLGREEEKEEMEIEEETLKLFLIK